MAKKPSTAVRIQKRHTIELPIKLSQEQMVDKGQNLARVFDELRNLESEHDAMKKSMKEDVALLETERNTLVSQIQRGVERRLTEVEDVIDLGAGLWRRRIAASGEVVEERPITEEERQAEMALDAPQVN